MNLIWWTKHRVKIDTCIIKQGNQYKILDDFIDIKEFSSDVQYALNDMEFEEIKGIIAYDDEIIVEFHTNDQDEILEISSVEFSGVEIKKSSIIYDAIFEMITNEDYIILEEESYLEEK